MNWWPLELVNMHPALPMQTSGGKCLNELKVPEPYSSLLPILPSLLGDFPRSPDPFLVSMFSDLLANPLQIQTNPMVSLNGQSDDCAFLLGSPTDRHFSSFSPGEGPSQNGAFISPPNHNACLDVPSAGNINYQKEDNDNSWSASQLPVYPDSREGIPLAGGQGGTSAEVMSDWDLCPSSIQSDWNGFLADPNVRNQPPEVPQSSSDVRVHQLQTQQQLSLPVGEVSAMVNSSTSAQSSDLIVHQPQTHQQLSLPSTEVPAMANTSTSALSSSDMIGHQLETQQQLSVPLPSVANPSTSAQSNKSRMRWTPELHEAFLDAVDRLGGSRKATAKGILNLMEVNSLNLRHVKSHLQKYRKAKLKEESSEGNSGERNTATERVSSVDLRTNVLMDEALRRQIEVQKQLHEQLEAQRKLQFKIEEHGRYLLQIIENQKKMEQEKVEPLPNGSSDASK